MSDDAQAAQHGIDEAFYANGPHGTNPVLRCLCGFETGPGNHNWELAGTELDDHLRDNGGVA